MPEPTAWLLAAAWTWPGPARPVREADWPQTLRELAQRWASDRERRARSRRRTPKE